jgi:hypothetical protein
VLDGDSDCYEHAWHFWWGGYAVSRGLDPRFCPLLGLPPGEAVVTKNIGWPDAILFGLATGGRAAGALWGAVTFGTLMAFIGGWAFARSWGLRGFAAAAAGFVFAWAPSRTAHMLQHYQIASMGWTALALASAKVLLDRGGRAAFAGLLSCTLIAGMESPYHLLLVGAGIAATLVATPRVPIRRTIAAFTAAASGAGATAAFFLGTPGGFPDSSLDWREAVVYSAEPQSFLLPSPFGLAAQLAGIPARYSWMTNAFEGVVTTGSTVLLLSVLAIRRSPYRRLLWVALGFCVLALGPELRFLGRPLGIPLPFRLLQLGPLLSWVRSPSRFAMAAALFASVPAAWLLGSLRRPARIAAGAALVLELFVPVIPTLPGRIPSFYTAANDRSEVVLEIPASPRILRYALFQTSDCRPRPVFFVPRGDLALPAGLEPFSIDSRSAVDSSDALETRVDILVYNRWLLHGDDRELFDGLYAGIFGETSPGDSILVWRRP